MEQKEFLDYMYKYRNLIFTLVNENNKPSNMANEIAYVDDNMIYFLIDKTKTHLLINNPNIFMNINKGSTAFTLTGRAVMVDRKYIKMIFSHNRPLSKMYPGKTVEEMDVFCFESWNGIHFDMSIFPFVREEYSFNREKKNVGFYSIIPEKCSQCGKCLSFCEQKCIMLDEKMIWPNNCLRCGKCVDACPSNAITDIK